MKMIIIYCHGFGSSSNSDKVDRLRAIGGSSIYAWDIDVDPSISLPMLFARIDNEVLLEKLHEPCRLIFVGTSLGAWYASKMADTYGAEAILINPSFNPRESLWKYGVSAQICAKYAPISWNPRYKYYIAVDDEVIDYASVKGRLVELGATFVANSNHRFNGPEFDAVVAEIQAS